MSAVNNVTDSLASATINDAPNTNGTPAATQATDAAAASADEGRRLYIGNLAYATTEEELKEFFKSYTMYVVTPHPRSLRVKSRKTFFLPFSWESKLTHKPARAPRSR